MILCSAMVIAPALVGRATSLCSIQNISQGGSEQVGYAGTHECHRLPGIISLSWDPSYWEISQPPPRKQGLFFMTAAFRLRLGSRLLAIVATCSQARGDGVIIKKSGQYLAEKDQQAFIEWK